MSARDDAEMVLRFLRSLRSLPTQHRREIHKAALAAAERLVTPKETTDEDLAGLATALRDAALARGTVSTWIDDAAPPVDEREAWGSEEELAEAIRRELVSTRIDDILFSAVETDAALIAARVALSRVLPAITNTVPSVPTRDGGPGPVDLPAPMTTARETPVTPRPGPLPAITEAGYEAAARQFGTEAYNYFNMGADKYALAGSRAIVDAAVEASRKDPPR